MTLQDFTDQLVRSYMRSEWVNHKREIGEFKAREELLSAAHIYTYEVGMTTPAPTFRDAERTTMNTNPVVFYASGEAPPVFAPGQGCDMRIASAKGVTIAFLHNVTE